MTDTPDLTLTGGQCPSCGKPAVKAFRPFCSKRCADADLGRWLTGAYVVPGEPADIPPDAPGEDR
jgi:hypothetical protein